MFNRFKKLIVVGAILLGTILVAPTETECQEVREQLHSHFLNNTAAGELSHITFVTPETAYIKLFSGISVADFIKIYSDLVKLRDYTEIRDITMILNSPGGSAFDGLSIADLLVKAQAEWGFNITVRASGIVASAAVPIFAVCNERYASPGTLFMVHEAALWKWPGRETTSDIISQGILMKKLQYRYLTYLINNSNLTRKEWEVREKATTWFTTDQARKWGLLERDVVDGNIGGPTGGE